MNVHTTEDSSSGHHGTSPTEPPRPAVVGRAGPRAVTGEDPALRAAYRLCRRLTRREDPVQYALIQLVPGALRPACWALWAAANAVDDLADDRGATADERAARVEAWITGLDQDLAAGAGTDPVRHALVDTALRWDLDLGGLRGALEVVRDDTAGRVFADWAAWRAWGRGNLLPWFERVRELFDRAGVPVALRLDHLDGYERFLDGFRLTDILTDLAADLAQGDLLLPREALERFPGAEEDLLGGRWSEAVAGLTAELTALGRRWVTQPRLTHGMHPGPATVLDTMAGLLTAQLDAVEAAGPTLLRTAPRPRPAAVARVLVPARLRSALAWRLTPLTIPPHRPRAGVPRATAPAVLAPDSRPSTTALRPPPAHPSGIRPPRIPADRMPRHVAIIMDGNGRWAEQRGLPRHAGHRAGVRALHETVHGALEVGLRHLTVYAFSTENWKRDSEEVGALLQAMREELDDDPYGELDVRLRWAGKPDRLPADLMEALRRREHATRTRGGLTLTVCVDYGGRDEITRASAALARAARAGEIDPDRIGEGDFARHLPDPDLPDVDLLWRTGKEWRLSNFLPWHSAYAELYFTDHAWPDVERHHLWEALVAYGERRRRLGAASPPGRPAARPRQG
ncbi:polyprenyl diphosphate synthase [Streptomyces sp. A012304]|uniref:polyprenyl diphosphate synthase n=1 Tax=Streptomyces sp. A012304 TaxID=375446 RepID=UPI0022316637|nr:polyprenyl diphosphate synthase [Streptomyces sp. A012304]